jgi:SAM-dependent methyltransferase
LAGHLDGTGVGVANASNLRIRNQGIYELEDVARFDLIVLDNVFEHLPDRPRAFSKLSAALRPEARVLLKWGRLDVRGEIRAHAW